MARLPMDATPLLRPRAPADPDVQGALHLVFRARRGATYLAEQFVQAPFRIVRPFALEDGSALLQLTHVAPGMMGGDAYRLDVTVEPGARVILIGASATKVHRMPVGTAASHTVRCTVMAGGALEYYPGLVIPFPDSEFVQTVDVTLAADARFGMLELWAMGRIERGEYLAFRRLSSRARVALGDRPCYLDAIEFSPDRAHLAGWGMLDGYRYVTSGYWRWEAAPTEDIVGPDVVLVSGVPAAGHLYARGLARDGVALCAALSTFLSRQRAAWGLSPIPFERYSGLFDPRSVTAAG
jgi:urease accessory protein